jgi:hypothetical protein
VSTGLTCVLEARDLIVTPLLKVIMPQGGRIDVSGRTGSIDVGTGGEKQQNSSLDAGAVIDVRCSKFLSTALRNADIFSWLDIYPQFSKASPAMRSKCFVFPVMSRSAFNERSKKSEPRKNPEDIGDPSVISEPHIASGPT